MTKLFHHDPELMRLVDASIQKRVQAAKVRAQQRRQTIFTIIVTVDSLTVGWLLSAVSPVSAVAQLVGR
jgi:hypothetical protein